MRGNGVLATLRSNRGDEEATFEFGAREEYAHESGALLSIQIRGRHWGSNHTHHLGARAEVFWVRIADMVSLRDHIAAWVRRPLADLDPQLLDGSFRLCCLPGQELDFAFGSRSDIISGNNPVVAISFTAGRLKASFYFVADQSCLNIFAHELSACIALVTG